MYTITYERNWQIEPYVMEKYSLTQEFDDTEDQAKSAALMQKTVEQFGQQARKVRSDRHNGS